MRNMDTCYKMALWLVLMLLSVQMGIAQGGMSKTVEKSFPFTSEGELRLENKYGNITLTGWEQDKVLVKVDISVNHRKRENAKSLLGRINPEFRMGTDYAVIVSEIANKNTGWFADFFNRNNPIDLDRSRVQIDYEVFLPKKAKLKITNRFGDVIIDDWNGSLNTLIEHGDLWVRENLDKADVIVKYGKVHAQDLDYASLYLKNGELQMENSKSLRLDTSGSDITMGTVNSLEMYSNKDDIVMTEAGTIYGNLKFSSLVLERLGQEVDLTMRVADFRVEQIIEPETEIVIEQESSDIQLTVTDFSHQFTAILEQGVVRLPKSYENVNSNMLDKGKKLREIAATYGKEKLGLISISGLKGIVTIHD